MTQPRKRITRAKRTYLGSGPTAKAKSKKTNRPYSGVLPSDKPSARKKTKSTRIKKAVKTLAKATPPGAAYYGAKEVSKILKKPAVQKAITTAVNKAIKTSPTYIGAKAVSKVIKKRTKPTARTMRKKAKR